MNLQTVKLTLITVALTLSSFAQANEGAIPVGGEGDIAEQMPVHPAILVLQKKISDLKFQLREVAYYDGYLLIDDVSLGRKGIKRPKDSIDHLLGVKDRKAMETKRNGHQQKVTDIMATFADKGFMCLGALKDFAEDVRGSQFIASSSTAAKSIGSSGSEVQSWTSLNALAMNGRSAGSVQALEDSVMTACY